MNPEDSDLSAGSIEAAAELMPAEGPADRLLRLWQVGGRSDVDAFLAETGDLTPEQLAAVLRVDQRQRWQTGQRVPAESYLLRYPRVRQDEEGTIDLVYSEFLLREKAGEAPGIDEYVWRFPDLAAVLRAQVELHQALQADPESDCETLPATRRGGSTAADTLPRVTDVATAPGEPAIADYEVLGELGRGGMGVVYRAQHRRLKRVVALKVLLAGAHAGPEHLARFRTEAEAAARLSHPNIVQVYEVGDWDGRPYLALEFVDGGSLQEKLAGRPQPAAEAARLVETLARAVHYAHTQGVVHRDLKPANVLLASGNVGQAVPDGPNRQAQPDLRTPLAGCVPKITDFGLAKRLGGGETGATAVKAQTRTGDVLGTPGYMAPEQARGQAAGPAADVYALGAILYDLLTGRPPFVAATPIEAIRQVTTDEPLPPARLQRNLPRDLETICLKCLDKEPHRRYASAEALADDLRRFLAGETIRARPVGPVGRLWRWGRRNPKVAALCGLAASLLVVIAVGSAVAALRLRESASERLWQARLAEARAWRMSDQAGRRFKGLEGAGRGGPHPSRSGVARRGHRRYGPVRPAPGPRLAEARAPRLEPYLRRKPGTLRLLGSGVRGRLRPPGRGRPGAVPRARPAHARNTPVQRGRTLPGGPGGFRGPFPGVETGGEPGASATGAARAPHARGGRGQRQPRRHDRFQPRWPAPGRGRAGREGTALRPRDRAPRPGVPGRRYHPARGLPPDRAAARRRLRVGGASPRRGHGQAAGGAGAGHGGLVAGLASPRHAPGGGGRPAAHRPVERPCPQTVPDPDRVPERGVSVAFSRGGDLLVGHAWDQVLRVWDPWTGRQLFQSVRMGGSDLRFSADDRLLAADVGQHGVRLLELARSPACRTLTGDPALGGPPYRFPAVSGVGRGRGRLLAVGAVDGVRLWDLADGTEVGLLPAGFTVGVAFDSSGALWTNGPSGLRRWPVADEPGPGKGLRVGPPERLLGSSTPNQLACSQDGGVVAVAWFDGAVVLHRDRPGQTIRLGPHDDVRYVAVSPKGEWVATGSHNGPNVKIWQARDGKLVKELPLGMSTVNFSPDGSWLLTCSQTNQLWRVGSWEAGPTLGESTLGFTPSFSAFFPDSKTVALDSGEGLRLVEADSGREVARLQDPDRRRAWKMTCSPDGARVVTIAFDGAWTRVWDLAAIGRELAAAGMEWELRAPEATTGSALPVTVIPADPTRENRDRLEACNRGIAQNPREAHRYWERGRVLHLLGRFEEAEGDFSRAITMQPQVRYYHARAASRGSLGRHAEAAADLQAALASTPTASEEAFCSNNLAWIYVAGPSEVRAPDKALPPASRAVRLAPDNMHYLNTLGVTYYRLERFDEAVATLRRSLRGSSAAAYDLYFLAMCHKRLGDGTRAQDYHDQAEYWMKINAAALDPRTRAELETFRQEAKALGLP